MDGVAGHILVGPQFAWNPVQGALQWESAVLEEGVRLHSVLYSCFSLKEQHTQLCFQPVNGLGKGRLGYLEMFGRLLSCADIQRLSENIRNCGNSICHLGDMILRTGRFPSGYPIII